MIERYQTEPMANVWSRETQYAHWLEIEELNIRALAVTGVIPWPDSEILQERWPFLCEQFIEECDRREQQVGHDVAAFVDTLITWCGSVPEARWVHYGLTSSDVTDTALALQLRTSCTILASAASKLADSLMSLYVREGGNPTVGRTHGQYARLMEWGDKVVVWMGAVARAAGRLQAVSGQVAQGKIAGPVGTHDTVSTDVEMYVLDSLHLDRITGTQVVPRDLHADYLFACAQLATACDLIATDLRLLASSEVREVREPRSNQAKGSSVMPQKRNPVRLERITGLSRVVRSNVQVGLDDVVLWHERDISHSSAERVILPESSHLTHYLATELRAIVDGLEVDYDRMCLNAAKAERYGGIRAADELMQAVQAGLDRDIAYRVIQGETGVLDTDPPPVV